MAYSGATAASSAANPPVQVIMPFASFPATTGLTTAPTAGPGAQGGGVWKYVSTNATTDITASNFFTDGYYLGMRPGDVVFGAQFTSAGSSVITFLGAITGVSTSGASIALGSLITSTFN